MKIKIPLKPLTINKAFQGRRYKTQEAKQYEKDLWHLTKAQPIIAGEVAISYTFYLKNHKRTDIDNLIKLLQDFLVSRAYIEDDRKIYRMTVEKIPAVMDRIEIEIFKKKL